MVRLRSRLGTVYVSSGRTVLATASDGFLHGRPDQSLFVHETWLLSRYRYIIEGVEVVPVSLSNVTQRSWLGYYIAQAPGTSCRKRWRNACFCPLLTTIAFGQN